MEWQEQVQKGMDIIKEGCKRNTEWCKCEECPFDAFCSMIYEETGHTPGDWDIDD